MSEKSKKIVRKFSRDGMKADVRWSEKDRTLQRRQARNIKAIIRTV
ncbi:hypothetical protein [Kitasatospora mediocidica]|nr:hypothetical protein [Kitasatospora mediocidica]